MDWLKALDVDSGGLDLTPGSRSLSELGQVT